MSEVKSHVPIRGGSARNFGITFGVVFAIIATYTYYAPPVFSTDWFDDFMVNSYLRNGTIVQNQPPKAHVQSFLFFPVLMALGVALVYYGKILLFCCQQDRNTRHIPG